jgi:hypothetical protein
MSKMQMFEAACDAVGDLLGWGKQASGKPALCTFRGFQDADNLYVTAWDNMGMVKAEQRKHFGTRLFRHCAAEMVFVDRSETLLEFRARTQGSGLLEVRRVTRTNTKNAPAAAAETALRVQDVVLRAYIYNA